MNHFRLRSAICFLATLVLTLPSYSQTKDELAAARARYVQELADCRIDHYPGDPDACVKEARSTFAEFKRGRMNKTAQPSEFDRNAMLRCEVHQGDDKAACIARMHGEGRTEGSISGGGILREHVTIITTPNQ